MKANIPTSYLNLPKKEKEKIDATIVKFISDQVNHEEAELQKIWLQYACIVLNRAFGFGEKRLLTFLGNWKKMYRDNSRLKGRDEQEAFLKDNIGRIFPSGYPYEFIDKMEDI